MRAWMGLIIVLACGGNVGSAAASCSCQCVEGVPHTLCNSLDEARQNPYACGAGPARIVCPLAPPADGAPAQYPPPAGAANCRSARLWDPRSTGYDVAAKVCEATANAAPNGGP